jgi:Outer membrane protein beta-barrel domain
MKDKANDRFDEGRQIDDLFRQGLENFRPEPSKDLWKGINHKLWWGEISYFTFTNLSKALLIGGIAGVMFLITALMVVVVPQTKSAEGNSLSFSPAQGSDNSNLMIPVSSISNKTNAKMIHGNYERQNKNLIQTKNILSTNILPSQDSDNELLANRYTSSMPLYFSNNTHPSPKNADPESDQGILSTMQTINILKLSSDNIDDTLRLVTPKMILNIPKGTPPVSQFFSFDMGVSPEVSLYGNNSSKSEMNFTGNLGINYHIGKFSVRSGIGLSYISDDGIYRVDYRSKDSVGFYNMVISCAINQQDPTEIIYFTHRMVVYDSLQHIADDRTRNRYTYMQVPLLAGFRILETNMLGLTVYAGPMVSFLIGKKEAQPVIDYPNARIIRIDNNTPMRIKTNWQLWVGLRLDYKISKEFSLFAEPYYKYYFKPVAEQKESSANNPYSIGLGIGIEYNFGRKIQKP